MELNIIIDYLIISIIASMAVNSVLRDIAKKRNILVDLPDKSRKFHKRPTPVTGGLGIFVSLIISGKLYIDLNNLNGYLPEFTFHLMAISVPLLCLFLIDDLKNLRALERLAIQSFAAIYMILSTGIYLESLGDLFGSGEINLGIFSIPFSVFCVVGVMNAFNMIDGMNGLCAGFGMLSLLLIGFSSGFIYDSMLILIIGSIVGFLLFNLTILGKQRGVFLGDHGSNLIGFWVAWSCIYVSQNQSYDILPITMLWFVAIPLLDCLGLIISRVNKGLSWATPGRDHIHHKLMKKYSAEKTLCIILTLSLLLGFFGIYIENNFQPMISTVLFTIMGLMYLIKAYISSKSI